jgi:Gpi18-like mannosyltransferase
MPVTDRLPQKAFAWQLALATLAAHLLCWIVYSLLTDSPFAASWQHMDSLHYSEIIKQGYEGNNWAFLPLYPLIVTGLQMITFSVLPAYLTGSVLSTALFLAWIALVRQATTAKDANLLAKTGLIPGTNWGWAVLICFPGAYIFHTHHTESLFLIVSFMAFLSAIRGRLLATIIFASLSVLSRNQGLFVVLAALLLLIQHDGGSIKLKILRSGLLLAGCGIAWAIYPLYQYVHTGNPFLSLEVQKSWPHTTTFLETIQTLWLGNSWQKPNIGTYVHHTFLVFCGLGIWFQLRKSWALALYSVLSLGIMFFQGEFANLFRFIAVVFPLLFTFGDALAPMKVWIRVTTIGILILGYLGTIVYSAMGFRAY